jgi:hypothetical protein
MRLHHVPWRSNQGNTAEHTQKALPDGHVLNKIQRTCIQIEQSPKRLFSMRALVSFWKKIDFPTLFM